MEANPLTIVALALVFTPIVLFYLILLAVILKERQWGALTILLGSASIALGLILLGFAHQASLPP